MPASRSCATALIAPITRPSSEARNTMMVAPASTKPPSSPASSAPQPSTAPPTPSKASPSSANSNCDTSDSATSAISPPATGAARSPCRRISR
jgi:hypothetical protein